MLPWLLDEVERTRSILGPDFWPYGLEQNAEPLRTFLRYSFDQGLAARPVDPEELFAPETLEVTRV
jgi:4,5-dihydroxyphthalate decarboxylase